MEKLPNWIRWILLLPLTIFVYVATIFFNRVTLVNVLDSDGLLFEFYMIVAEGILAVGLMLLAAYSIAPSKKKTVAIAFSIVLGIISVTSSFLVLTHVSDNPPLWKILSITILTIISSTTFCVQIFTDEQSTSKDCL